MERCKKPGFLNTVLQEPGSPLSPCRSSSPSEGKDQDKVPCLPDRRVGPGGCHLAARFQVPDKNLPGESASILPLHPVACRNVTPVETECFQPPQYPPVPHPSRARRRVAKSQAFCGILLSSRTEWRKWGIMSRNNRRRWIDFGLILDSALD